MEFMPEIIKPFATLFLGNDSATARLAERLAPHLAAGDMLLLQGDLGAGKTSFARALIQALCGQDTEVPSPTFTLMQLYEAPAFTIAHFDLYRLTEPGDILELGWYSAREGVVLVEWPERLGALKPDNALTLCLTFEGAGRRADFSGSEACRTGLMTIIQE